MEKTSRKKPNVSPAQKLTASALIFVSRVIVSIGRPFYLAFYYLIVLSSFLVFLLGYTLRKTAEGLTRPPAAKPRRPAPKKAKKAKLPQVLQKAATTFTEVVSKLKILPKLLSLKITLSFIKAWISIRIPIRKIKPQKKALFILFVAGGFTLSFWYFILRDLPSPKRLIDREQEVSTKIYDRNGILLYTIYKDKNRTPVGLEEIPMHVRLATLAAEDAEFYTHPGFSVRGIIRAVGKNIRQKELAGGSTITQQLVKNALLSPEKTITRKIREIILSIGVEAVFKKDEILEMYLNEVSYGGTAYGIQEASRVYFAKDVSELTISESAILAGLPKSPTKFSPFGSNPELAILRQKEVLNLMRVNKFITEEEEKKALEHEVVFAPDKTDIKAPHFVMYVRQMLVETYSEEVVEKGGLEVITSLDYSIQELAQAAVEREIAKLSSLRVGNGAAIVINPKTGEILAMVGSKDYFDTAADGNVNVTTRPRQPGSAIKVVNYAYALSTNFTPASIISDTPVTFAVTNLPPYTPRNYDGSYRGNISLRSALAESRNIPAVKVLASYGVTKMVETGEKMGITTWTDPSRYGLSLTLGGGETKLIDLANVYATVADEGRKKELISVLKVTNYKGKVLQQNLCSEEFEEPCQKKQAIDPRVAFILTDILKDNPARSPAFGSSSYLVINSHPEVAVKTGTSNDLRDNLTVGYNQDYLTAVWVGNNDNSPMARVASGVTGASPIWNAIMSALLKGSQSTEWEVPLGVKRVQICALTGTLPCTGCPTKNEWFLEEKAPTKASAPSRLRKSRKEAGQRDR